MSRKREPDGVSAGRKDKSSYTEKNKPDLQETQSPCDQPIVQFTLIENSEGLATKQFRLDDDGNLVKKSAAQIYNGKATRLEVAGIGQFMRGRALRTSCQALCYGVADVEEAQLVTQRALSQHPGALARDRDHLPFQDGKPGIIFFDHDPKAGAPSLSVPELDAILCEAYPPLADVERAYTSSASAYIYTSDGRELIGPGGLRCYAVVDDAA
jgi:hypothetical protein